MAFRNVKSALTSELVLRAPDFSCPFRLQTGRLRHRTCSRPVPDSGRWGASGPVYQQEADPSREKLSHRWKGSSGHQVGSPGVALLPPGTSTWWQASGVHQRCPENSQGAPVNLNSRCCMILPPCHNINSELWDINWELWDINSELWDINVRIMRYKLSQSQTHEPFVNKLDDSLNQLKDFINMQDFFLSCTVIQGKTCSKRSATVH